MNTKKSIGILNSLIKINNDRIQGYETASKEVQETDLKTLFSHFTETSLKCKAELVTEVKRLGGKPTKKSTTSGKFYRCWINIKSSLIGRDRKSIINSCQYGEDATVETYLETLKNSLGNLTSELQMMIKEQYLSIKADHERIKRLRDLIIDTK